MSLLLRNPLISLRRLLIFASFFLSLSAFSGSLTASGLPVSFKRTSVIKSVLFFWNSSDDAAVLQSCMDLPQIQQYYPVNTDGTYKQVYIMQYPVAFDPSLSVSKFGKSILFEPRPAIYSDKAEGFFIIKEFNITGNSASVSFRYYYHYTTVASFTDISLTLQKSGDTWTVLTTAINS